MTTRLSTALAPLCLAIGMAGIATSSEARAPGGPTEAGTAYIADIAEVKDCPFSTPRGDLAACFEATVPENYADVDADGVLPEDAPRLTIAIAVLSNFLTVDDPDPIVMIAGGPGQGSTMFLPMHGPAL
ncbi:MAG: hypothetical protein JJU21_17105, partial [Salinarimonas sp.]|nr:hypothetical protein [Salinarimonas sp.]